MVNINSTHTFFIGGKTPDSWKSTNKTWFYNHVDEIFIDGPKLNTARFFHAAGLLLDSVTQEKLVVVTAGSSNGYEFLDSTEIFRDGKWEKEAFWALNNWKWPRISNPPRWQLWL